MPESVITASEPGNIFVHRNIAKYIYIHYFFRISLTAIPVSSTLTTLQPCQCFNMQLTSSVLSTVSLRQSLLFSLKSKHHSPVSQSYLYIVIVTVSSSPPSTFSSPLTIPPNTGPYQLRWCQRLLRPRAHPILDPFPIPQHSPRFLALPPRLACIRVGSIGR